MRIASTPATSAVFCARPTGDGRYYVNIGRYQAIMWPRDIQALADAVQATRSPQVSLAIGTSRITMAADTIDAALRDTAKPATR